MKLLKWRDLPPSMRNAACNQFNNELNAHWTSHRASPYPGQLQPAAPERVHAAVRAAIMGRMHAARDLFERYPVLGVWATLSPLARSYGENDNQVYTVIEESLGLDLSLSNRDSFKDIYRKACRSIGVLLDRESNKPTEVFFAPTGVADSKIREWCAHLAEALALYGPPAVEDTPSALDWQRRALLSVPVQLGRVRAAIAFDRSAYYAEKITVWRRGAAAMGERDRALFAALDCATAARGLKKDSIVGPPSLIWRFDTLAVLAEPAKIPQEIKIGVFSERLVPGKPRALACPWPNAVSWKARRPASVPCAPQEDELLVFDVETGELEYRGPFVASVDVKGSRLVALSAVQFQAEGFGSSCEASDARYQMAWCNAGAEIEARGQKTRLTKTSRPSISVRSAVLGHTGRHALRAGESEGRLEIQVDPQLLNPRILRVSRSGKTDHCLIEPDAQGRADVTFSQIGLTRPGDPERVIFELLMPGAGQGEEARVEIRTSEHMWPGVKRGESGNIENAPCPVDFNPGLSAGFISSMNLLSMDPGSDADAAVLARGIGKDTTLYALPFRGIRLWRYRVSHGDKVRVPLRKRMIFGPNDRQDSLVLDAPGCMDDLIIKGEIKRKPFYARSRIEIPASALFSDAPTDDTRIALVDESRRVQLLAQVETMEAARCFLVESGDHLDVHFCPARPVDAVGVRVLGVSGETWFGLQTFSTQPVGDRLPSGFSVEQSRESNGWFVVHTPQSWTEAARVDIVTRETGFEDIEPEIGEDGMPLSLGLLGPAKGDTVLRSLSELLAQPTTEGLSDHPQDVINPIFSEALRSVARPGLVTPLLVAWAARRPDGGVPRGDLLSAAPATFEAALTVFGQFANHPGLEAFGSMSAVPEVPNLPNPNLEDPLGALLDRVAEGVDLPPELDASSIDQAFIALDARLSQNSLRNQLRVGSLGRVLGLICQSHARHVDRLRSLDRLEGQTPVNARYAAILEQFARASRTGRAAEFFQDLILRTGLSAAEVGEALSVLIRTGPEFFAFYLTAWSQAAHQHKHQVEAI